MMMTCRDPTTSRLKRARCSACSAETAAYTVRPRCRALSWKAYQEGYITSAEPAPLTKIRARTLAIYAAPTSAEVMYPSWYAFDDSARQRGRTVYVAVSAEHEIG